MGWNGSGTYTRTNGVNSGTETWKQDATDGTKITTARHDAHDQDLADGINNCLAKDGQNKMTGNLDLNGFSIYNLIGVTGNVQFTGQGAFAGGLAVTGGSVVLNAPIYATMSASFSGGSNFGGMDNYFNAIDCFGLMSANTGEFLNGLDMNGSDITNARNIQYNANTKHPDISGIGVQSFDLDNGWLVDSTISGSQEIEFVNGSEGANGVIKLINTNGNTLDLSGAGLTFKRSIQGVLYPYAPITLEAGAATEQLITYHFQSATEVVYTVK